MKDVIVTYSSRYGHTEKYAKYIANQLNCKVCKLSDTTIKDFKQYDIIIFCSYIRNNMIVDCNKFTYNYDLLKEGAMLYVFADGILKPTKKNLEEIVIDNFYKADVSKVRFFYGEGGLNIESLYWSDSLLLKYYIEEGLKKKLGEKGYEFAIAAKQSFDHSNMTYADKLIAQVRMELDEWKEEKEQIVKICSFSCLYLMKEKTKNTF